MCARNRRIRLSSIPFPQAVLVVMHQFYLPSLLHKTTRINIIDPIESYAKIVDSFTNTI